MKSFVLAGAILVAGLSGCSRTRIDQPQPVRIGSSYTLPSSILRQTRRINVYLPPGYAEGNTRYPVLYLLDGGVQEDFVHIAGIASLAADFRRIREFIVVGIEGIDRYHDLTHPTTVESDRQRLPTSGGASAFRRFLATELKPFVEGHFRVSGETVLMGESAAGLFVVETLLREPQDFSGYVAVSPMLWWDNQSLARQAESLLRKPFPPARRLYLTIADEGGAMQEGMDRLVLALKSGAPRDLDWTFVLMAAETHGTTFHPAALNAVRRLFAVSDSVN
jgi:predicted alpha/beta superfamily hydrolase